MIQIQFPTTFRIVKDDKPYDMYYIKYGLDDISEDSPVGLEAIKDPASVNYFILRITNFKKQVTPREVSVILRLQNPNSYGSTTPVKITSFTNILGTSIIDQNVVSAKTSIENNGFYIYFL